MKNGLTAHAKELERRYELYQIKNTEILTIKISSTNTTKLWQNTNKLKEKKRGKYTNDLFNEMEELINNSNFWKKWNSLYKAQPKGLAIQNGDI